MDRDGLDRRVSGEIHHARKRPGRVHYHDFNRDSGRLSGRVYRDLSGVWQGHGIQSGEYFAGGGRRGHPVDHLPAHQEKEITLIHGNDKK